MSVKPITTVTKKDVIRAIETGYTQAWDVAERNGLGFSRQQMDWDAGALASTLNDMLGEKVEDLVDLIDIIRLVARYDNLALVSGDRRAS